MFRDDVLILGWKVQFFASSSRSYAGFPLFAASLRSLELLTDPLLALPWWPFGRDSRSRDSETEADERCRRVARELWSRRLLFVLDTPPSAV
mmetsp:Transcript_12356/g.34930  ORF Transcript_12356/g.34930 Transcript_12356/m.34930 type:complete len:92 (+) Transcript_12356:2200-2475(+)